ncbi:hypothetical protein NQ315_012566 [Exocentrus adspersus]|uniref:RWD domain-containing protein n=1 Tax=Exocentrus adspersus TaxID=1586481 RepID=A0AAV8VC11_9CUCU|nr:hypothetical protein NQ315_012566 [Exocentrus adspersus]
MFFSCSLRNQTVIIYLPNFHVATVRCVYILNRRQVPIGIKKPDCSLILKVWPSRTVFSYQNNKSDKLPLEKIRENLQTQLSELESLQSVFYNPGEIRVEDMCTLSDIKNFVNGHSTYLPQYLDLTVNLLIENLKFELCVTLSHEYPYSSPEIFVRNHKLNRSQHVKLNKDLCDHVAGLERGEPCIFNAVSWLQDNAQGYVEVEEEPASLQDEKNDRYIRYWIYSHHIYSKTKRREIVDLANLLHINGFCMPGKLGLMFLLVPSGKV